MAEIIKLQVGEKLFTTTRDVLVGESAYFSALLSPSWNQKRPQQQGGDPEPYFIDSDPDLFREILLYLRSGNFPLYFDLATRTYDYGKYQSLLGEAQYFRIGKLVNWIREQRYLAAVKIRYEVTHTDAEVIPQSGEINKTYDPVVADTRLEFSTSQHTQETYLCPRRIPVHFGRPEACGRQCENARRELGPEFKDERVFSTTVVRSQYVFDHEVCLGENVSEVDSASVWHNPDEH
jgi:hypothetical protein